MKVLMVIPAMSPEAGAETSLYAITPFLRADGFRIEMAVLTHHQGLVPDLERQGVVVHDLSGRDLRRRVLGLRRVIRASRPDLVHATLFQASLASQLAALGTGVPLLVSWANTPIDAATEGLSRWKMAVVRATEALLGAISRSRYHAVTEGVALTKRRELRVRAERVRVAERGRDAGRYAGPAGSVEALRTEIGVRPEETMFLSLGRQEPQKAYPDMIRAFARASASGEGMHLVIAGREGSASDEIERVIAEVGPDVRVTRLGHRSDVPELLAAADAIVCASHREGAAGALIEAMAAGTPILAVELDGMIGVLEDGVNSVVVPRHRLAEGFERVASDPAGARARAEVARQLFFERFTIERSAAALGEVYRWAADRPS